MGDALSVPFIVSWFVLISFYFKTIIYFTGPEMTEQTFVYWPLSKSYFEPCILFVINFVYSVFIYNTVTHGEISSCWRSYFSGNKMKRGGEHDPEQKSI